MAFPKICGIETEFGIVVVGQEEFNPVIASSLLINSYANTEMRRVRWDFDDESPGRDARGFTTDGAAPPEIETHLVNVVLTNGARYYVDHAHPEYSSPECADALEATLFDKAGEQVVAASVQAAQRTLTEGQRLIVYKNNSDGKGNSYGCHENYLIDRRVPFGRVVDHMLTFLTTRQVVCGAGKVGSEHNRPDCDFQVSARADFFEEEVGLETTLKRPIVNTRDEPHSDPSRYRRLHVIVGDANMSEVATWLKLGTTSLVLAMVEETDIESLRLLNPVASLLEISHDPTCTRLVQCHDGSRMTAVEVQWDYFDKVRKYLDGRDSGPDAAAEAIMDRWEQVLNALEDDPMRLDGVLDWPTKYGLVDAYRERGGLEWSDPKLRLIDLQYHDVRPDKGVAYKLMASGRLETILDRQKVAEAVTEPPEDTRAYFRGRCLARYADAIVAANWDSIVFDTGDESLRRVPMLEPARGTRPLVGDLLDRCSTATELLAALGK
ncbi:MAG: proteasome accessory factor PafA2 [Acidimicrobiia bacterium]|nr:proteasome accessory factor PafA2 [Acidimicrobiia bacterium]